MTRPVWTSEKRKISELIAADFNPREMNEKENADLKTSLTSFGLVDEIVINLNNKIIGGHQRVRLLKGEGVTEVDVRVPDRLLDKDEELELALRLNKNRGRFNFDELVNVDEAVLLKVGFDEEELRKAFKVAPEAPKPEVQFTEEMKESHNYIVLKFENEIDWLQAQTLFNLPTVKALDSKEGFEKRGVGRVVDGAKAIERIRTSGL